MKRKILMLSLVAGCLLLTSCASKKELVNLQTENKSLNSNYQDAKEQLAASRSRVTSLEEQIAQERKNNQVLRSAYDALQGSLDKSLQSNSQTSVNITKLVDEINASNAFIKRLVEAKSKSDSLNMALTNKLTRSLSTNELKEVDVQIGRAHV